MPDGDEQGDVPPGGGRDAGLFQHSAEISANAARPQTAWARARACLAQVAISTPAEHAADGLDAAQQSDELISGVQRAQDEQDEEHQEQALGDRGDERDGQRGEQRGRGPRRVPALGDRGQCARGAGGPRAPGSRAPARRASSAAPTRNVAASAITRPRRPIAGSSTRRAGSRSAGPRCWPSGPSRWRWRSDRADERAARRPAAPGSSGS